MSLTHNAGHRSAREAVSCSAAPQGLEPVIEGGGTLEADWQRWPGLSLLQEIDFTELTQVCARVVVVAPHPDDEVLACGGLLAMLSDCWHPVTVISVTDGDASHPGSRRWPRQLLAQQWHAEALEALSRLGLKPLDYVRLSLPDGQVQQHESSLSQQLISQLLPSDLVISTWVADAHPDHESTARATAAACAAVRCTHWQAPVWMWHWAAPADRRVPWHQLKRLRLTSTALQRKTNAIQAHASQLQVQDTGAPAVLPATMLARMLRQFEYVLLPESL